MRSAAVALGLAALCACYPATTRPAFLPMPSAALDSVELFVPEATQRLAIALNADSIPVRRTEPRDGWLETGWFDAETLQPTRRRPLGTGIVRIRAWVDPGKPNYSNYLVETLYIPAADPSRTERELERQVPADHPVALRVRKVLNDLSKAYGGAEGN